MLLALLFFICQIIFGFLIFDFFDPEKKFHFIEKIISSILIGISFSGFLILIFSLIFKSLILGIYAFFPVLLLFLILRFKNLIFLFKQSILCLKQKKWFFSKSVWLVFLLLIVLIYITFLTTVIFKTEDGSLKSALIAWGDNAFHLSTIERFATVNPFNLEHPYMGGVNLSYPFMINFISGIFRKLGAEQLFSYRLPIFVLGIIAILLIFAFAYHILKSKFFAILALIFILWGSGLGFLVLFKDLDKSYQEGGLGEIYQLIKNPPHEYTHLDNRTGGKDSEKDTQDNIVWITPTISFLSHQRTFVLGLAIFLLILLGIYYYGKTNYFWRFGFIAGLLPLSHTHSFLALFFLLETLFWFFLSQWKTWLKFALATLMLSLPQIIYYGLSSENLTKNFKPWFGWMMCKHQTSWFFCNPQAGTDSNIFWFWSKNFGIVFWIWLFIIFFLFLSFFLPYIKKKMKNKLNYSFISASIILFLMPNLFLFQPWEFDNNKILFYWWILAIIFCLIPFLRFLWQKKIIGKSLVIIIVFLGILAGSFDFIAKFSWTKKTGSFGYSDYSKENVEMAQWIKENSIQNALFLTSPIVDPVPLFLAGRPVYMGFEGWLWTQGLNYLENRRKITEILSGNLEIACQEKIDFILLDNNLKKSFPILNEKLLLAKTETVFSQKNPFEERKILKVLCQN
jgi:hypothetical protein